MPYILMLSTLLLITGCFSSPQVKSYPKLAKYTTVEAACQKAPPQTLKVPCSQFLKDLKNERLYLDEMHLAKKDDKMESEYITLADKEALLSLKIDADKALLAQECHSKMPTIIANNDISSAEFCLVFDENSLTLEAYQYLKRFTPKFDKYLQFVTFEKAYAKKKIQEGLKAMSHGNKKAALTAFKVAAEAKSAEASYLIGIIYEEKQIKKSIYWHKKAVEQGVDISKVNLARLFLRIKLPQKARAWYVRAANDKNALAQYQLFKIDVKSTSLKRREEAHVWLTRSASNNYPQAQYILGLQLLKQKKSKHAQVWLEKALANGVSDANFYLGKIYFEQKHYAKAYPLLRKADKNGEASFLLATMFESGLGIKKNSVVSYRYYKKAHEQGHDNHIRDMKRLQRKLTKRARIASKYIGKKEAAKTKKRVKSCGQIANSKNITRANRMINIIGVAIKPIKNANGFVVYGDHEKLYYIIDAKMAGTLTSFAYVNIKAKATAKAIVISSDNGTLQKVYQFHSKAICK